jgi:citrate lyase subunit beta/citryl-CoA lyase
VTVRLRRSELAVPASQARFIAKAAEGEADLVFLDLEDAVAPAEKVAARERVIDALNNIDWGRKTRAVRINDVRTVWCHDDIVDVVTRAGTNLDIIIVPKVKAPRDVWFVETLLAQLEAKLRLPHRIGLEALVEETEALARVEEIAACSPRLEALILGVGDLSASQGIRTGHVTDPALRYPGDMWHYARNRMIVAARAAGIDAIDGPYPNYRDADGYRREATWGSTLGCVGKWCIHPSQIAIANDVFAPTEREIALAKRMCEAYEAASSAGAGAAGEAGVLVDAASVRIFEGVLERARLTGRL